VRLRTWPRRNWRRSGRGSPPERFHTRGPPSDDWKDWRSSRGAEPDYGVMKYLSVHVSEAPLPSVRCVEILLRDPDQAWEVYSPGSPAWNALRRALLAGDEARSATEAVINRLSAPPLGYTQLQSILTDPSDPGPPEDDDDDDVNDY
jgi:hypothetical protein